MANYCMSEFEESTSPFEITIEDSEELEIINSHFKSDPLLKFEAFQKGVSFTYTDSRKDMSNVYVSMQDENKSILISHLVPYWFKKNQFPNDKINRMLVSNMNWNNVIGVYADRIVKDDDIHLSPGKQSLKFKSFRIPEGGKFIKDIFPRVEKYLELLLNYSQLSKAYPFNYFRGDISQFTDYEKYVFILNRIREINRKEFKVKNLKESECKMYNHPPFVLVNDEV